MGEGGSGKMERDQEAKTISANYWEMGLWVYKANEDGLRKAMLMENREEAMLMENREDAVPGEEEDEKDSKTKEKTS